MNFFGEIMVVSADVELNRYVMQNEMRLFRNKLPAHVQRLIGDFALVMLIGDVYRHKKAIIVPFINKFRQQTNFVHYIERLAEDLMASWNKGELIYMRECATKPVRGGTMSSSDAEVVDVGGDPPKQPSKRSKSKDPQRITRDSASLEDRLVLLEDIIAKMGERYTKMADTFNSFNEDVHPTEYDSEPESESEPEDEDEFSNEERDRLIEQIRLKRKLRAEKDKQSGYVPDNQEYIFNLREQIREFNLAEEGEGSTVHNPSPVTPRQTPPPYHQEQPFNTPPAPNRPPRPSASNPGYTHIPYYDTVRLPAETYNTGNFPRYGVSTAPEEQIYPYGRNVRSYGRRFPFENPVNLQDAVTGKILNIATHDPQTWTL
uniref:Uncharacterized protein n=1 Tax=Ananas comosus var. bracteatus TaxID=296719 RepID=A0A6V7QL61_ANACO|nr:unnamed protein product [Ananas comosus var. bracteatus]